MSKRLQILVPESEYQHILRTAKKRKKSVSELTREGLRLILEIEGEMSPQERLAKVMSFSRYSAPTADITEMLAQIEAGREA
jgi:hypothetical protein